MIKLFNLRGGTCSELIYYALRLHIKCEIKRLFTFLIYFNYLLQTDLEAVVEDVELINDRMRQLRHQVAYVKESNRNIEGMAKALVKHFNIPWDRDDDDDEKN